MINFLVVLLNGQSENGSLKLLPQVVVTIGVVELDQEPFSSFFTNFVVFATKGVSMGFDCALHTGLAQGTAVFFFALEHAGVRDRNLLDNSIDGVLVILNGINHMWESQW